MFLLNRHSQIYRPCSIPTFTSHYVPIKSEASDAVLTPALVTLHPIMFLLNQETIHEETDEDEWLYIPLCSY